MSATSKHDSMATHAVELLDWPDGLTATGVASAWSHSFDDDHPGLVAFPVDQVRLTQEAILELSDLLCFLRRSLISDAERDAAPPAWHSIASRAAVLAAAVLSVMGGDDPSVAELAEKIHGNSAGWPAWVLATQAGGAQ